jgi:hypothetical protein
MTIVIRLSDNGAALGAKSLQFLRFYPKKARFGQKVYKPA